MRETKFMVKSPCKWDLIMALTDLLYGSECWTNKAKFKSGIVAAEMKFTRKTLGYTCTDYKANIEILTELIITSIEEKLSAYKTNWSKKLNRMPHNGLPLSPSDIKETHEEIAEQLKRGQKGPKVVHFHENTQR